VLRGLYSIDLRRLLDLAIPQSRATTETVSSMRPFKFFVSTITSFVIASSAASAIDAGALQSAKKYSSSHHGFSLLVIQNNRTVLEDYPSGHHANEITSIYSGTKGFWCVAAAAAAQDGILDLDEHVQDTISEWRSDPRKEGIRIRDLLHFTAGIEPVFSLHGKSISDRNGYSIKLAPARPPGDAFMYGPSQLQIFSEVLRRKLASRRLTPEQYLERRILRPLGIAGVDFREDKKGNPLLASGFKLTARQWAQLGKLISNDGKIGRRQLVRADLLKECFRGTRANPMFGMGFWLNREAPDGREIDVERMLDVPWERQSWRDGCLSNAAPPDTIAAIGSGFQRMYIVPSQNLIIVRQARNDPAFSDTRFLELLFRK
jgi:CubicO group peptidase (beta-lactamase class C family)